MGRWTRGTVVPFELTIENRVTLARQDVSEVSCYILKDDIQIASLVVSHVSTGFYRASWQTTPNTALGCHKYQFKYKYQGTRIKQGVCEVIK